MSPNLEQIAERAKSRHLITNGIEPGQIALELILGEATLIEAARFCMSHQPGTEVVRIMLRLVRPQCVADYCWNIFEDSNEQEERREALWTFRDTLNVGHADLVTKVLQPLNSHFHCLAILILKELYWLGLEKEEMIPYLKLAEGLVPEASADFTSGLNDLRDLISSQT